jgi:ABC-type sugar transport system permease subunit
MGVLTVSQRAPRRAASPLRGVRPAGRRAIWVAWFLLPGLALFIGLVLLPILVAALLSFSSWNGSSVIRLTGPGNWIQFIHDPAAAAALERTFVLVAAIFFLPALFSSAALGILWSQLLSPVNGGVQYAGTHFGLAFLNHDWLGDVHLALATVIGSLTVFDLIYTSPAEAQAKAHGYWPSTSTSKASARSTSATPAPSAWSSACSGWRSPSRS